MFASYGLFNNIMNTLSCREPRDTTTDHGKTQIYCKPLCVVFAFNVFGAKDIEINVAKLDTVL